MTLDLDGIAIDLCETVEKLDTVLSTVCQPSAAPTNTHTHTVKYTLDAFTIARQDKD